MHTYAGLKVIAAQAAKPKVRQNRVHDSTVVPPAAIPMHPTIIIPSSWAVKQADKKKKMLTFKIIESSGKATNSFNIGGHQSFFY